MTQTLDPHAVAEPSPRRRGRWPAALLVVLSLLLLTFGLLQSSLLRGGHECCAIDCEAYPEQCERRAREHVRWRQDARNMAVAGYAGSAVALGAAVLLLRRR